MSSGISRILFSYRTPDGASEQADPDSIETADVLYSLGVLSTEQKQYSAAITAYLGSLQINLEEPGQGGLPT